MFNDTSQNFISLDDLQLRCIHGGDPDGDDPFVFLHGFTGRAESALPLLRALPAGRHGLAYDLRGHGYSDRAASYRIVDHVADLLGVLQRLGRPATLYGHSLGGLVALLAASQQPDRVQRVIAEDPPLLFHERSLDGLGMAADLRRQYQAKAEAVDSQTLLRGLGERYADLPLDQLIRLSDRLITCDPRIWDPLLSGAPFQDPALHDQLIALRSPTLILYGEPERGSVISRADRRAWQRLLPEVSWCPISGAGHHLRREQPQAVIEQVLATLERDRTEPPAR